MTGNISIGKFEAALTQAGNTAALETLAQLRASKVPGRRRKPPSCDPFTTEMAEAIRQAYRTTNKTAQQIAAQFNVNQARVSESLNYKR